MSYSLPSRNVRFRGLGWRGHGPFARARLGCDGGCFGCPWPLGADHNGETALAETNSKTPVQSAFDAYHCAAQTGTDGGALDLKQLPVHLNGVVVGDLARL